MSKKTLHMLVTAAVLAQAGMAPMPTRRDKEPYTDENGDRWFWSYTRNEYVKSAGGKRK